MLLVVLVVGLVVGLVVLVLLVFFWQVMFYG